MRETPVIDQYRRKAERRGASCRALLAGYPWVFHPGDAADDAAHFAGLVLLLERTGCENLEDLAALRQVAQSLRTELEGERARRVAAQEAIELRWQPALDEAVAALDEDNTHTLECVMVGEAPCVCGKADLLTRLRALVGDRE